MLNRLIIMIAFCVTLYLIYLIVIRWQISRAGKLKDKDPLLLGVNLASPTIVYFTTPMCALCRTTQFPAIERLQKLMDLVNIVKVDATIDTDSSKRWGVMSVPTTFILDKTGTPVKVNNGFVDENTLSNQLKTVHIKA